MPIDSRRLPIPSLAILAILVASITSIAGAQDIFLGSADANQLRSALGNRDFVAVAEVTERLCSIEMVRAEDRTISIAERYAAATRAARCAESIRGTALASLPFEQRPAIEPLLNPVIEEANALRQQAQAEDDFLGLKWGIGVGYSFSTDDAIDDASIVDGVVRVSSSKKEQPRVFLEFHKYFWCVDKDMTGNVIDGTKGCGPFMAVAAKDGDVLGGVAVGFMFGRKVKKADSDGFSVGIGAILDADIKDLADGFVANEPPPGSETAVRFETKSRWSWMLMFTRTF